MNVASPPRSFGLTPATCAAIFLVFATAARLFYCTWPPILPDEAYYFQWSRHLDTSYFSKGPAIAYTIAAGTALWGDNVFGIRFFAVLLSAGTGWQLFCLARRWFDDATGLVTVLIVSVVPIYTVGAVLMTIDPLSAFFWVWSANLFSEAIARDRLASWLLTGFAVGSGFLAKYVNALELLSFLAFLALVPAHRRQLTRPGFWAMLLVALVCASPVFWWNAQHHWVSADQLANRGKLHDPLTLSPSRFIEFLGLQSVMLSPLLFIGLLFTACAACWPGSAASPVRREGELLLLMLFVPVFLLYAALAWHLRCEPNWPAISYLSLIVLLASRWQRSTNQRGGHAIVSAIFLLAWLETIVLQTSHWLPLPPRDDPMGRTVGWSEIAGHLQTLGREQGADVFIADGYKEASAFSFNMAGKPFIYTLRHAPPSTQFDFWPACPTAPPHRALWITAGQHAVTDIHPPFNTISFVEKIVLSYRGEAFRSYDVYLCRNL